VSRALLDVNVLVALLDRDHVDHRRVTDWLRAESGGGWALGEGHRPDALHRLPRLHDGLQVGERGPAVGSTAPTSSTWTSGVSPGARAFQVTRCNQCEDAPCVTACPTARCSPPDGIVDFDKSICIGCKACIAACPYDAIFINPEDHSPRSATSAPTASTSGWSRRAWWSARSRRSWSAT
jgi:ferredoxin